MDVTNIHCATSKVRNAKPATANSKVLSGRRCATIGTPISMPAIVAGSCRPGKLEGWANAGERIQQKLSRTHLTRIVETHQYTSLRFICHPHHNPRVAWRQTSVGQYQLQEVVAVKSERRFCSA